MTRKKTFPRFFRPSESTRRLGGWGDFRYVRFDKSIGGVIIKENGTTNYGTFDTFTIAQAESAVGIGNWEEFFPTGRWFVDSNGGKIGRDHKFDAIGYLFDGTIVGRIIGQPDEVISGSLEQNLQQAASGHRTEIFEDQIPNQLITSEIKEQEKVKSMSTGLLGYEELDRMATLAVACGEHAVVIGKKGMGKTLWMRQLFAHLEGDHFIVETNKFDDPSVLFGLMDMQKLRESGEVYYHQRQAAAVPWFGWNECFDASDHVLRAALGLLEERKLFRGKEELAVPLRSCIATANYSRVNEVTEAFIDRLAFTGMAPEIDVNKVKHLFNGQNFEAIEPKGKRFTLEELDQIQAKAREMHIPEGLLEIVSVWANENGLSYRRMRKFAKAMKVNAVLEGRSSVDHNDVEVAQWMLPLGASRQGTDYSSLVGSIQVALNEAKQLREVDRLANYEQGAQKLTTVKNICGALRQLGGFSPVSDKVNEKKQKKMEGLKQAYDSLVGELGIAI